MLNFCPYKHSSEFCIEVLFWGNKDFNLLVEATCCIRMKWNCRHLLLYYSVPSEFKGEISNSKCLLHVIIPISSVWSWDTRLNSTDVIDWSIVELLSVFVIKRHLPAHWTYSGLHLGTVLWNHSKLFSLLYLQFYSLHLILTTQTPNGVGTQRVKHFYCFYNQSGCFDSYYKFNWLHS